MGLAVSADGSVFITSDDMKQFILKVTPPRTTDVIDQDRSSFEIYPNPAGEFIECDVIAAGSTIQVYNSLGKIVDESSNSSNRVRFNTSSWPNGTYIFTSGSMNKPHTRSIIIAR
ncbi:MAG: T9SS type A sorting domain-containing protein [Candidatus Kapabacteria bacterium]|nr:T9SS type A sorting domain-containing protein [Candidatus Kapabacteria bacterium]